MLNATRSVKNLVICRYRESAEPERGNVATKDGIESLVALDKFMNQISAERRLAIVLVFQMHPGAENVVVDRQPYSLHFMKEKW